MKSYTSRIASMFAFVAIFVGGFSPMAVAADGFFDGGYDGGFTGGGYGEGFSGGGYDGGVYGGGYSGYDSGIFGGGYEGYDGGVYGGGYEGYDAGLYSGGYEGYDGGVYSGGYDGGSARGYDFYPDPASPNYGGSSNYGGGTLGGYRSTGGYSSGGSYQLTATPWSPVTVSSPRYPTTPSYSGGGSSSSYSSSNTSVTNTSITNIDNSIRDSFNNYNSNNVVVAEVKPATPQYPVVYTTPSCEIRQALASGSGVTSAYLSWTSTNATSAMLSNVGSVATVGSQTVWPTRTTTYTLTVIGQNGQSTQCSVTVQANTYVPPVTPYVSLTQIPYTGFDFGPFGNTIYWATLASFALALGYLAIYFKGGVMAFATARAPRAYAPVVAPKAPILVEREAVAASVAPIVASMRKTGTTDSMAIVLSKDGSMPRIVIDRS